MTKDVDSLAHIRNCATVAAEPGLLSSVDLPLTIPRNAFVTQ
jgi:hypothetical protein